jgi:hypothetical protein
MISLQTGSSAMLPEVLVKFARKSEMIHFGIVVSLGCFCFIVIQMLVRTLATDKGFKERVREDMLVRLLDAFVWRNHGRHTLTRDLLHLEHNYVTWHRPTRILSTRFYLCPGNECAGCSILIYYAVGS